MKNILDLSLGPDLIQLNIIKNKIFTDDIAYEKKTNIFHFFGGRLKLIRKYFFDKIVK